VVDIGELIAVQVLWWINNQKNSKKKLGIGSIRTII
jgi:hypothetical protein